MMKYNLAASNNVTLDQAQNASQLVNNADSILCKVLAKTERLDRRMQQFFNAQASTRGRKVEKTTWGFERNAGF